MVLVLLLFLVRPGAQSLRIRVVRSVGLALGRPVDVGWVTLRLLPQPGFDLQDFVVHEDPEFGSEPVLRSSDVVAILRVGSLFRGRLEIARLSLTEPSINLVRNAEGRWNLEKLVERAATTPVAPTAKARSEARPGFPYIEADHGRINFKFGQEKKPYALTDANFALWQASENTWGMRLKAQPMRSDFNLSDTGLIDIDGSWQRSATLHETPVKFTVQWEGSQLGQLTKLTLGQDKGWRGTVRFSATLAGTPKDLTVLSENSIEDFRRYDISSNKSMRLAARCSGHYSTNDHILSAIACRAPVGDGEIVLSGSLAPMPGARACNLTMLAHELPVQPLVEFARRIKKNVPADIVASGKVNANVALISDARRPGSGPEWRGGGEVLALDLRSQVTNTKLVLDKIPFALSSLDKAEPQRKPLRVRNLSETTKAESMQAEARVEVGPFNLALGRTNSATVRGMFSHSGYSFQVQGDAEVQHLLEAARTIGLPAPQSAATGEARINLNVAGNWAGFSAAGVTGNGQLHSVRARVRGLNESVEINSADITLTPTSAQVRNLVASAAGNNWRGTLTVPRQCDTPSGCVVGFDLHADEFVSDELSRSVAAVPGKQPWYSFLSSSQAQSRPYLASLHAEGKLSASHALIHNLVANRVSADVELDRGQLRLSKLRADLLGGRHSGEWRVDFTVNPPAYRGSGTLEKIVLGQIADAMQDNWITGTANVAYSAGTLGWTRSDLLAKADASFEIEARDGSLPHLILAGDSASLHVNRFEGRLLLRDGKFALEQSKLQTPVSIYQVSGTATLDRILDIKMTRDGARSINITGTLKEPHVVVSSTPETQAALKP
jgi:AsmA-like C-terminal region/AsmA family